MFSDTFVEKLIKNKIYIKDVFYLPLKKEMENFIIRANKLITKNKLNLPKLTNSNTYFKWNGDGSWLSFYPYLEDQIYDVSEDFNYILEMCWGESDGGDWVCINDYGFLMDHLNDKNNIEELNTNISAKDFIKIVLNKDLCSIFGCTKSEFEKLYI